MSQSPGARFGHYDGGSAEDARIMSLEPGQSLGPYKVATLIGERGMGQA